MFTFGEKPSGDMSDSSVRVTITFLKFQSLSFLYEFYRVIANLAISRIS